MQLILRMGKSYFHQFLGVTPSAWRGIILNLIESTLMGIFYFLSLYFIKELHWNIASAGTIISFYGIGAIAGGILGGKLCDRLPSIYVTIASLSIQAISYLLFCFLTSYLTIAINMFFLGIASYAFITSNQLWVLDQCRESSERLKAINLLSTSSNLGLAISAVVISLIMDYGFRNIFIFTGAFFLLLTFYLLTESNKYPISHQPESISPTTLPSKKNTYLIAFVLSSVLFVGMIVSQLGTTYPLYITNHFSISGINAVGFLFAVNSLLVVLFETPLGNILGGYNKVFLVGAGSFLIGFGMLMLTFSSSFLIALLACVVYTFGEMIFFCMTQFICYQQAGDHKKGHALGLFRMTYAASRVLGPIAGGYLYYHLGGELLWCFCGLIGLIYLLITFIITG